MNDKKQIERFAVKVSYTLTYKYKEVAVFDNLTKRDTVWLRNNIYATGYAGYMFDIRDVRDHVDKYDNIPVNIKTILESLDSSINYITYVPQGKEK